MLQSGVYRLGQTSLENQMSAERSGLAGRKLSAPGNSGAHHAKINPAVGATSGSLGPTGIRSHAPAFALEYRKAFQLLQTEFGLTPAEFEFNALVASRYSDNETEWGDYEPKALLSYQGSQALRADVGNV
jgi:hypothetical protein